MTHNSLRPLREAFPYRVFCVLPAVALLCVASQSEAAKEKFDRNKPHLNVGTIGHVDHGKTTLTAAITKILGGLGAPTFPPLPQVVHGSENGAPGVVRNSCDVEYETAERIYRHFDCGGQENFVRDWIMGNNLIEDGAILVVSAADGPTPQTREHILLARQVGVPAVAVYIDEIDLVSDELVDLVELEIRDLLRQYEFPGDDAPVIRGSIVGAHQGEPRHVASILELLDEMDEFIPQPPDPADRPFLMPVEDVFSIAGRGTVAKGRVERGKVTSGDLIEIVGLRPTRTAEVTGLEMFRKLLDEAQAGDKVGVLLRGVEKDEVERGQVLAAPGSSMPHTKFRSEVYVLDRDDGGGNAAPFFNGYRPQFYFRTTDVTGTIELPMDLTMVLPGGHATVQVELLAPVAMEQGLRFQIQDGNRTVGAGVVADILE